MVGVPVMPDHGAVVAPITLMFQLPVAPNPFVNTNVPEASGIVYTR